LPLFAISEQIIRGCGDFLPHGAVLSSVGEYVLVAAAPKGDMGMTNSVEVLPDLHKALCETAREQVARAIGVAESVTATLEPGTTTKAVKVLCEHSEGLVVALYLPYQRKLLGGYRFSPIVTHHAEPEVQPWAT
jgi:hypothetical protein